MPRISVVVPFYNNEELLGDCLASIAAQSFADFEVLMVDDGSADDSAGVAAAQAAADPRFTLIRLPHGGSPGYTRNAGIRQAAGEYLAFVDADDTLPPEALERLLRTLEQSGSDFVTGGVLRPGPAGPVPSPMHARAIKTRQIGTHISRNADLFFDVSVWNKMYRKSFWDAHELVFPEGVVWEDLQLVTKAHVLAKTVDIIPDPIYLWRERDKGAPSITQSRTSISNFRDRITALTVIDEFLRQREPARLVAEHQRKALFNDLWLYVPDLARTSPEYVAEFVELTGRYLAQVKEGVLRGLPSTHKLAYHLIARGLQPELTEYAGYLSANSVKVAPIVREHGRIRADLPFRDRKDLRIPASVYAVQMRELDPRIRVDTVGFAAGKLVVSGLAFVPSVDISKPWHSTKIVLFRPLTRGRLPVVALARPVRDADASSLSEQDRYDYSWAGFRATISTRRFRSLGSWKTGEWDAFVLVRGRSVWRAARLHSPAPGLAERPAAVEVAPGLSLAARWAGTRLHVRVMRAPAGRQESAAGPAPAQSGAELGPVVDGHSWSADGTLTLRGRPAGPGATWAAELRRRGATETHALAWQADGDRFTVEVPATAMPVFGDRRALRDGVWTVQLRPAGEPAAEPVAVRTAAGTQQAAGTGEAARFGPKTYALGGSGSGELQLTVAPVLGFAERGKVQRLALREAYYPLQQRRPLRDAVVFISFRGRSCSDNPLGISQELRRRGDDREHIWVVSDWSVPAPAGSTTVLAHGQAYWDALARSRYVISNDDLPARFRPHQGQTYVQTWHGTLLKRIGFDVPDPQFANGSQYLSHLAADVAKWDLLLSPNPFSTPHMRRAFRYDGEIYESGYPRNDLLCRGDSQDLAAEVRARLGIPAGKKVVMYAPTWRDDQFYSSGQYRFDLRLDLQDAYGQLGDEYVFLVRGHHQAADDVPEGIRPGFVLNVTAYPDIAELFLVADALVTDYSSMACDFAATGKPMVFFAYDLADYRDNLRGFNIDFEAEVPGPVLTTSAQVVAALGDLGALKEQHRARYEAFVAKFCPLDDGKAGARACDRIFGG